MKTYTGRYSVKNPKKYKGDPTNVIYRSSWESRVMNYLDNNPAVLEWSSEETVIPYISPVDNKRHRYFVDFWVKAKTKDGNTKVMLLEVKPKHQTKEPTKKSKITRKYITEVMTWGVNQAKWAAAEEYCADRGWEFRLITEDELGL